MQTRPFIPRLTLLLSLLTAQSAGCGDDAGPARVSLPLTVAVEVPAGLTTASGWTVLVQEGALLMGPVYLLDATPVARGWTDWLVPAALAHVPASDGAVIGEWLGQARVPFPGPPVEVGVMQGQTGRVQALEVQLEPPAAVSLPGAAGATVVLQAVATRDAESVAFGWSLVLDRPVLAVTNVPANVEVTETTAGLTLTLDLGVVLAALDLDAEDLAPDGTLRPEGNAALLLGRGIGSRAAWRLSAGGTR
jgi:hypothetical protein